MMGGNKKGMRNINFETVINIESKHVGIKLEFNAFALNGWSKY